MCSQEELGAGGRAQSNVQEQQQQQQPMQGKVVDSSRSRCPIDEADDVLGVCEREREIEEESKR